MRKKPIILFFLSVVVFILCFFLPGGGEPVEAQTDAPRVPPVRNVILKYNTSADMAEASQAQAQVQMERLREAAGIELTYFRPMSGDAHVLRLPERLPVDQAEEIARRLEALPEVAYAHPDYILTLMGETQATTMSTPNDPRYPDQWHYFAPGGDHYGVNAPAAWDITTGSASIVVAVMDTGYLDHPDLSGKWIPGYDMISNTAVANDDDGRDSDAHDPGDWVAADECGYTHDAQDSSWHGTHVAGTIGALGNNLTGVAGLNWLAKILPVRVLGKCGGETSDIVDAIHWAAGLAITGVPANANPADVINISLGGYTDAGGCDPSLQSAITNAYSAGTTIVVAAGNEDDDASNYTPANCQNVITVAATDRYGDRGEHSNYGSVVEISAPGGAQEEENDPNGVLSTLNAGATTPGTYNYEYYQGTSMAASHVAGIASLLLSYNRTLTPAQVLSILQNTVTPFPAGSDCNTSICGSGIVNAGAALAGLFQEKIFIPLVMKNYVRILPGGFNKTAPANGASSQPNNPTLSWGSSDHATSYEYCYDTSNDNNCDSWTSTGSSTSIGLSTLLYNSTYYWQVRAQNSTGTTYADGSETSYWSFTTGAQPPGILNGDFELGTYGWTESSSHGYPLILESAGLPITPHSGSHAARLGGDDGETSYIQQEVTIPVGAGYLVYWYWIASEDICGFDFGKVVINTGNVEVYNLCQTSNTGGWVTHSVNLSAYIGQTVTLQIRAETDSSNNSYLYVDDISLQSSPAAIGPAGSTVQDLGALAVQSKIGFGLAAHQLPGLLEEPVFDSPER